MTWENDRITRKKLQSINNISSILKLCECVCIGKEWFVYPKVNHFYLWISEIEGDSFIVVYFLIFPFVMGTYYFYFYIAFIKNIFESYTFKFPSVCPGTDDSQNTCFVFFSMLLRRAFLDA